MKKTFKLNGLDCACCAAKMEDRINKLDCVTSASVSFMSSTLTLETENGDFDSVIKSVKKAIKKIEPDCELVL